MLPPGIVIGLFLLGFFAGTFGGLAGLGGGIIIVPVLILGFGLPIETAVGISLVCVIATSSSAASVYVERGWANLRLGMVLELTSVLGAVTGAAVITLLPDNLLKGLFGAFVLYASVLMVRQRGASDFTDEPPPYTVRNHSLGLAVSYLAGGASGLLGIGGGPIQVPLMNVFMGLPLKVAIATSAFMIGVKATAGALLYYARGDIIIAVAAPLALGVFAGSQLGSRLSPRIHSRWIRWLFVLVLFYLAALMLGEALGIPIPGRGSS